MKRSTRILLLFLATLSIGVAAAQGVAFVTDVRGTVTLDGSPRPALLAELTPGQKLALAKDAQASIMFAASGREYVLKGPGEYVVGATGIGAASGAAPAVRTTEWQSSGKALVQVGQTAAASVRMRSIAAPRSEARKLIFPTDGAFVTLQPTLRWQAADAKAPVELAVTVPGEEKPAHSAKAAGGSYRIAARLKPDTDYVWTLTSAGEELGSARFRTLPADRVQELERRRPPEKAAFSDRVMYAVMLQDAGARQEAQELWSRLAQERADLPELASFAR